MRRAVGAIRRNPAFASMVVSFQEKGHPITLEYLGQGHSTISGVSSFFLPSCLPSQGPPILLSKRYRAASRGESNFMAAIVPVFSLPSSPTPSWLAGCHASHLPL